MSNRKLEEIQSHDDEMSLKEMILLVKSYLNEFKRKWLIILFSCIVTCGFFLYLHFNFVPEYKAKLKFVVEGQSGVSGGLGGLLGSFGIKKGGQINPYKLLEVGKSTKLLERVLRQKGKADKILAQEIIDEYKLVESWTKKNDKFQGFKFPVVSDGSEIERAAVKKIRGKVWGSAENKDNALGDFSLDDETGIYKIEVSTIDEDLSIQLAQTLYSEIKYFFEDEIFSNQKKSSEILLAKVDSLRSIREIKIRELGRFQDRNRSVYSKEKSSQEILLSQDIQSTNIAYAEILKNYELTDVNLKDMQPLFIEIDFPNSPIKPSFSSLKLKILLGLILGGFIACLYILIRKVYKDAMD